MKRKTFWDKIFGKEEEEDKVYFIIIDFSDEAYDKMISHWSLKKLYHVYGDEIVQVEDYSKPLENMYRRMHIPIIDVTKGQVIPKDYRKNVVVKSILGRISLGE